MSIALIDYELSCAAGVGLAALRESLANQRSGLKANNIEGSHLSTWVGSIPELDQVPWLGRESWQSRNNALIDLALEQGSLLDSLAKIQAKVKPERIGVVIGSSTSSIDRAEAAYRELENDSLSPEYQQAEVLNPHAPGLYVAEKLGLTGPNLTLNTACSSSAKVFATAARWLELGLVDAALVGGADTLCLSVLHGFHSLQLVSESKCRPFDKDRDGINLGEGAGFALLTRSEDANEVKAHLLGYGESSDAHHMSHPHPEGLGAKLAIEQALSASGLNPEQIDYINLHGTASRANDDIEGKLISTMFGNNTKASSTKGWMGHTLGAAGIVESLIAVDSMHTSVVPGTLHFKEADEALGLTLFADNLELDPQIVMSNSFGFGGNNACLIFAKAM